VTEAIEYEQFEQAAPANGSAAAGADVDLSRLSDIPMELSVEIGRTHMTVGETLDLRAGSVVALERLAGETADLLVNGTAIARGEVVVIDEQYGLRITEILDGHGEVDAGAGVAVAGVEPADADARAADGQAAHASDGEAPRAPGGQDTHASAGDGAPAKDGQDPQIGEDDAGEGGAADER